MIGCFCDSFNYLEDKDEVRAFLKEVRAHLNEGGLFLLTAIRSAVSMSLPKNTKKPANLMTACRYSG
ncbi:L-histidine N(alpha)-methyltransferase [Allobaculum sp. Allo2]|uniref:L-histidine N(alpha)-methyltransferase n=1 Tax=Allobaculum sp. Allo2 TaxID=2853432 RepID=UPI001F610DD0|nr:L-histidine N(alpha)-methyltransferase [Allobaculum sp. Allo2]UNT93392.1 L-histidine N(alpha)-methyltransferase [Allobaculum sp. Allo2]